MIFNGKTDLQFIGNLLRAKKVLYVQHLLKCCCYFIMALSFCSLCYFLLNKTINYILFSLIILVLGFILSQMIKHNINGAKIRLEFCKTHLENIDYQFFLEKVKSTIYHYLLHNEDIKETAKIRYWFEKLENLSATPEYKVESLIIVYQANLECENYLYMLEDKYGF